MQEAIEECYERLGRYFNPDIKHIPILMGSGDEYYPRQGRCARTGLNAEVVDHLKSEVGVVPIHTKLLWMIAYQKRINKKDGKIKPLRITRCCIAFLPREILTTINFTDRIPYLRVVEKTKDIVKRAMQEEKYLFLGFGLNGDRVFGNDLRYSSKTTLEINGDANIAGIDFSNQTVDLALPQQLSTLVTDWNAVYKYFGYRNRPLKAEEHEKMMDARRQLGNTASQIKRLTPTLTWQDLRIAKWLDQ